MLAKKGMALGALLLVASGAAAGEPGRDWSGAYVGLHVGAVGADFENNPPNPGPVDETGGPIGGGLAGYNLQRGRIVFGVEADVSAMDMEADGPGGSFDEDLMVTLRGRVGYAFGRWLPFATMGLGLTRKEIRVVGFGEDERLEPGLAAGAGVERILTDLLSLRGEYLYVNVPDDTLTVGGLPTNGGSDNHVLRAALVVRF